MYSLAEIFLCHDREEGGIVDGEVGVDDKGSTHLYVGAEGHMAAR